METPAAYQITQTDGSDGTCMHATQDNTHKHKHLFVPGTIFYIA